jgi:hypothetical protein
MFTDLLDILLGSNVESGVYPKINTKKNKKNNRNKNNKRERRDKKKTG